MPAVVLAMASEGLARVYVPLAVCAAGIAAQVIQVVAALL